MSPDEIGRVCELIAIACFCSWAVCLATGVGLCTPDRALLLGVPGTLLGGASFEALGWALGPLVAGYPVVPGLVGTTFMVAITSYVKRFRSATEETASKPPLREWTAAPLREH